MASFSDGRQYMSQSEEFLRILIKLLIKSKKTSAVNENILGSLQKLSLKYIDFIFYIKISFLNFLQ